MAFRRADCSPKELFLRESRLSTTRAALRCNHFESPKSVFSPVLAPDGRMHFSPSLCKPPTIAINFGSEKTQRTCASDADCGGPVGFAVAVVVPPASTALSRKGKAIVQRLVGHLLENKKKMGGRTLKGVVSPRS